MISENIDQIIDLLKTAKLDSDKCEKGNVSAGRRVRKTAMLAIKDLKKIRALILEMSKK